MRSNRRRRSYTSFVLLLILAGVVFLRIYEGWRAGQMVEKAPAAG